jgi:hypothetical protein
MPDSPPARPPPWPACCCWDGNFSVPGTLGTKRYPGAAVRLLLGCCAFAVCSALRESCWQEFAVDSSCDSSCEPVPTYMYEYQQQQPHAGTSQKGRCCCWIDVSCCGPAEPLETTQRWQGRPRVWERKAPSPLRPPAPCAGQGPAAVGTGGCNTCTHRARGSWARGRVVGYWVSPTRGPRWVVSLCCDRYNCTTGTQVAMPPPPGFKGLMEKIEMIEDQCGDEAVRSWRCLAPRMPCAYPEVMHACTVAEKEEEGGTDPLGA